MKAALTDGLPAHAMRPTFLPMPHNTHSDGPRVLFALTGLLATLAAGQAQEPPSPAAAKHPGYEHRPPTRDGIGKYYLGREIAHVVGGEHSNRWLERPERIDEERPDIIVAALELKPGMQVADIGAGTGYYSWRMAREVGKTGKVHAVELEQEMLDLIAANMKKQGVANVHGVLGTITDPKLPENSLDLVVMVDVYHEFSHPYEMMQNICRAVKPGGRVVWVEFRLEDESVPIKTVHKMSEAQVKKEAAVHPLEWVKTVDKAPWQHIIVFRKK
jgi:precorrin-6B methylase 2